MSQQASGAETENSPLLRSEALGVGIHLPPTETDDTDYITDEARSAVIRCIFAVFHLVVIALGIALVCTGSSANNQFNFFCGELVDCDERGYSSPIKFSIYGGAALIIIGVIGGLSVCGGEIKHQIHSYRLSVFILIIHLFMCTFAGVSKMYMEIVLSHDLEQSLSKYVKSPQKLDNQIAASWDRLQSNIHCCGVQNYTDWEKVTGLPDIGFIPESCCIIGDVSGCTENITRDNFRNATVASAYIHTRGCAPMGVTTFNIGSWLTYNWVISVFLGVCFVFSAT